MRAVERAPERRTPAWSNMQTPHGAAPTREELSNAPAEWWREKKAVADKIGNALLVSLTPPMDVRRVVGLFQSRASGGGAEHVQLKTAASKRDGASIRQLKLEDALDGTKWMIITHFYEAVFDVQGDQAHVMDTVRKQGEPSQE